LYYNGKAAEAAAVIEEVLKEHPDNMNALLLAGEIYKSQRKLQDAIAIYKKIVMIKPDNSNAVFPSEGSITITTSRQCC